LIEVRKVVTTAASKKREVKPGKLDKPEATRIGSRIGVVAETLEGYARRGVFRGFSQEGVARQGKAVFKMLWHRNRVFEMVFEPRANTLRFSRVLPDIPADSSMYRELKEFIKARYAGGLPEHRRIDNSKAKVQAHNRGGSVSLTLQVIDGDDEYATRKLIHLLHEIFLTFLLDGRYYDYMVENFDLDPDQV
jgi:hypothetical protein